ncbi:MAG: hypothetical protein U1F37_14410 [Alphaproteobacteria bacterium]
MIALIRLLRAFPASRRHIGSRVAAPVLAFGGASTAPPTAAQEIARLNDDAKVPTPNRDAAQIGACGLDLTTIEQATDADLLWRVVGDLVLPGKVGKATQIRILRRVWQVEPAFGYSSFLDSPTQ